MNITIPELGWVILAFLLAGIILGGIQDWFTSQYKITRRGFRLQASRRWYGPRAHVCLRSAEDDAEAERYLVTDWDTEHTGPLWIRVQNIDDDGADARWAPVTDFAPYAVRRIRPWLFRYRRLAVPVLFSYWPLRQPSGYLGGARDAA